MAKAMEAKPKAAATPRKALCVVVKPFHLMDPPEGVGKKPYNLGDNVRLGKASMAFMLEAELVERA